MKKPACTINLRDGKSITVAGTLEEVQKALDDGRLVRLDDPWGKQQFLVNTENVTTVQFLAEIEISDD